MSNNTKFYTELENLTSVNLNQAKAALVKAHAEEVQLLNQRMDLAVDLIRSFCVLGQYELKAMIEAGIKNPESFIKIANSVAKDQSLEDALTSALNEIDHLNDIDEPSQDL